MDIGENKQYSLRWEKHAFNLASEAGYFFEDESFLDCTLSAEGQCIDAHKIILSASSSYLSSLLKIMPDKHPILIFNDIKFEQLKSLVAFIYNGSVNVSENNIHAFLNAAQSLLIKGLSEESKSDEKITGNIKKPYRDVEIHDIRTNHRKHNAKPPLIRKSEMYPEPGKNSKRQRHSYPKLDGGHFVECEESLSKLQEISFTKYIHQNLTSKSNVKNDNPENKWNGPVDEKLKTPENYVVKSWKHKSVEDLNGKHKQNKNNTLKKIRLEKQTNSRSEEDDQVENSKISTEQTTDLFKGKNPESTKIEDSEYKIKTEIDCEEIVLVEPKQEIIEEEDTNVEDFENIHSTNNAAINSESDSTYDGRPTSNFFQSPVERGIPVPLLMCRTSLSEPDSIEPNWMPNTSGNSPPDQSQQIKAMDNNSQDLQCRTCTQDLPCPTCTKKYKSRYALNRHILYECGKARKSFSCDECGKKVTRQDTLQKHKLIHLVDHLKRKENEGNVDPPKPKKLC